MSPIVHRISSNETLPASADVVVIGGGIVGAATAYFLAKRGVSVALLEKGHVGGEQSSRNWGWCRTQNRDARELPLAILGLRLWEQLTQEIGQDLGFRRCGLLFATDDPDQLAEWERWQQMARPLDVNTRMLTAREAALAVPAAQGRVWRGGVHSMDDGKAEPALAAPLIAEGARRLGATIHQDCAVRGLELSNGAVSGVITERGRIAANAVVCAAGAWSSAFLRLHGVSFPQVCVRQSIMRTGKAPDVGAAIYTPDCAITRRLDGTYTLAISGKATLDITPQAIRHARAFLPMFIARLKAVEIGVGRSFFEGPETFGTWSMDKPTPMERIRVLAPAPDPRAIATILARVKALYPAMAGVEVASSWAGAVDCTPDAVPAISLVDRVSGLVVASGCSGHGFGVGPGIGHLAADLVTGDPPRVNAAPFRLSRFHDGSKTQVGAI